ncbi:MAG: WecB/TagA/CpsF family glycosyltransferase [Acidimicrobiales bacterium]
MARTVEAVLAFAAEGNGRAVHLCNAYTLALARKDPAFAGAVNRGDLNLPDGTPLVWVGRRLGLPMEHRVYGPDLMLAVCEAGRAGGVRHYLYGSSPDTVACLGHQLEQRFPGVLICGVESPPFRALTPAEERDLIERVRGSAAQVVWVGLGTPRQDEFVDRFRDRLGATLVAVGAAFDFNAGVKRQAPRLLRDHGLEWAFRLATEPSRLWRRYLIGNASFVMGALRGGATVVPRRTGDA